MATKIGMRKYQNAVDGSRGFCTVCRKFTREMTEPDAEHYDCPKCDGKTVMGAENALMVGEIDVS